MSRWVKLFVSTCALIMVVAVSGVVAEQMGEKPVDLVSYDTVVLESVEERSDGDLNEKMNNSCLELTESFQKALKYHQLTELTLVEKIGVWDSFLALLTSMNDKCSRAEEMAVTAKENRQKLIDLQKIKEEPKEVYSDRAHLQPRKIAEGGNFVAYDNGVVYDRNNNLEWVAGPDIGTDWYLAKYWVETLVTDGGEWRMPTMQELKTLYSRGGSDRNMTPLIKTTGWLIWSGERHNRSTSWLLNLDSGQGFWLANDESIVSRGFAVRKKRKRKW